MNTTLSKQCARRQRVWLFCLVFTTIVLFQIYTTLELKTTWRTICIVSSIISILCIIAAYLRLHYFSRSLQYETVFKNYPDPRGTLTNRFILLCAACVLSLILLLTYHLFCSKDSKHLENNESRTRTPMLTLCFCFIMVLLSSIGMYFYLPRYWGALFLFFTLGTFIYFMTGKDNNNVHITVSVLITILFTIIITITITNLYNINSVDRPPLNLFPHCSEIKSSSHHTYTPDFFLPLMGIILFL
jgi:NADH:ubiquinone oxidoreductase subunit 5 (subunit L)/multisubunit Na+/H+ antiporter MnhA subunit